MRYVYFIQAGNNGPIKIGVATDPSKRIAELQTGCPDKLRIVAIVEGEQQHERALHERFSDHRLEGEWFKPAPILSMLSSIRDVKKIRRDHERRIICDHCKEEIARGTNGVGEYGGLLTWRIHGDGRVGGFDFLVVHKNLDGKRCDVDNTRYSMELDVAVGPHGMATLVHFLTEPHADRTSLERIIHSLYFDDGELVPPASAFDPKCKDKLWGYEH